VSFFKGRVVWQLSFTHRQTHTRSSALLGLLKWSATRLRSTLSDGMQSAWRSRRKTGRWVADRYLRRTCSARCPVVCRCSARRPSTRSPSPRCSGVSRRPSVSTPRCSEEFCAGSYPLRRRLNNIAARSPISSARKSGWGSSVGKENFWCTVKLKNRHSCSLDHIKDNKILGRLVGRPTASPLID